MAAVLLARRCGLACDCYGPCSDSKVLDTQYGFESGVNALLGLAAKPRLLSGVGEIQSGAASCLEVLVVDNEVLNNVRYALTPRPWDADALDVEAMIDGALSGRGFLGTKHTRRHIRSEFVSPLLSYRGGLGDWLASGRAGLVDLASDRVAELSIASPPVFPTTCWTSSSSSLTVAPPSSASAITPTRVLCSVCRPVRRFPFAPTASSPPILDNEIAVPDGGWTSWPPPGAF